MHKILDSVKLEFKFNRKQNCLISCRFSAGYYEWLTKKAKVLVRRDNVAICITVVA